MKKFLAAFLILVTLSGCTIFQSGNETPTPTPVPTLIRPTSAIVKTIKNDDASLVVDFYYLETGYRYFGVINAPTPCSEVKVDVAIMESFPEQVTLSVTFKESADACAQVITKKEFTGALQVSKQAEMTVKAFNQTLK